MKQYDEIDMHKMYETGFWQGAIMATIGVCLIGVFTAWVLFIY